MRRTRVEATPVPWRRGSFIINHDTPSVAATVGVYRHDVDSGYVGICSQIPAGLPYSAVI
jgi:hypothetical protein